MTKQTIIDSISSIKNFVAANMLNNTTYFVIVYTAAIILNGIYETKLDTNAILMGYGAIAGKSLVNHTINSTLNSDRGSMPMRDK